MYRVVGVLPIIIWMIYVLLQYIIYIMLLTYFNQN